MKYQHVVPQEWPDHEVIKCDKPSHDGLHSTTDPCVSCHKPVTEVDDNEGPEGLKAMFMLGPQPRSRR